MSTQISPMALELADAAKILSKLFAKPVSEAMLREDVVDGAPTNPDGTLNLVHYAAWLVREVARAD
jgi:hypothetical protein